MTMTTEERRDFAVECERRRKVGLLLRSPKTYGVKEELKEAGAIWDGTAKGWLFPDFDTLNRFELQLDLPVSYDLRAPTNRETVEAIVAAPTVEAAAEAAESYEVLTKAQREVAPITRRAAQILADGKLTLARALEEAEMIIEARETELADIRFRLEALATALSACSPERALPLCKKVATALVKIAYADRKDDQ